MTRGFRDAALIVLVLAVLAAGASGVWRADAIIELGWSDPDGALLGNAISTLVQLLATFVSILIVYVVFKLTFIFQRFDEQVHRLDEDLPDIREVRDAQRRMRHLLAKKEEYVRPLHGPITAMTLLLIIGLCLLPFTSILGQHPIVALRTLAVFLTLCALSFVWTIIQAFGAAIER